MAQNTMSFPLLDYAEIIDFLDGLEFMQDAKVTRKDFTQPEPVRWRNIYASFFEYISGQKIETIIQRKKLMTPDRQYGDIFDDTVALITFARIMRKLVSICDKHDFTVQDLVLPQGEKRLKVMVCALINFIKFQSFRSSQFEEIERRKDEERQQTTELKQANESVRQQIDTINDKKKKDEVACEQLRAENVEKLQEIETMQGNEADAQKEYNQCSARIVELDHENEKLSTKNNDVKKQIDHLTTKIVQSPAAYRDAIVRSEEQKLKMQQEQAELKDRFRECKQHAEERAGMLELVEKARMGIASIDGITSNIKVSKEDSSVCNKELEEAKARLHAVSAQLEDAKNNDMRSQEMFTKLKLQMESKIMGLEQTRNEYLKKKDSTEPSLNEVNALKTKMTAELNRKLAEKDEQIAYWKDMENKILEALDNSQRELVDDYTALLNEFGLSWNES